MFPALRASHCTGTIADRRSPLDSLPPIRPGACGPLDPGVGRGKTFTRTNVNSNILIWTKPSPRLPLEGKLSPKVTDEV